MTIALRIVRSPEGSSLVGAIYEVGAPSVIIGRAPTCDIPVPDLTVSSRHVRLEVGPPIRIHVLTRTSGTFLNRQAIDEGGIVEARVGQRLQLGGVLMAIEESVTRSVREPIDSERVPQAEGAPLRVRFDLGVCLVEWNGTDLGLTGDAARFLGLLAPLPDPTSERAEVSNRRTRGPDRTPSHRWPDERR